MWSQALNLLVGLWLTAAPGVLGYNGPAALNHHILGPIAASAAVVALWECTRAIRWLNLPIGVWLLIAPWVFAYEPVPRFDSLACGLLAMRPVLLALGLR